MCGRMAPGADGCPPEARAHPADRTACPGVASRQGLRRWSHGHDVPVAGIPFVRTEASFPPASTPVLAQQCLAATESVVRDGSAAYAQARGESDHDIRERGGLPMSDTMLRIERIGAVARLVLARPEKLNSLTAGVHAELRA